MLFQTAFHRVFQPLAQMAHVRFHSRKRVHTRLSEKDRAQRLTRRNTGPSLLRSQLGFVLPAKFLLFHHAFIYIHFPVPCESSLSATAPSQTIFHCVFQLLAQMAHVCFCRRKWVRTLGFRRKIAHKGLHGGTCVPLSSCMLNRSRLAGRLLFA